MDAINDWENQALTHRNRLAPHAYFMGYETADLAASCRADLSSCPARGSSAFLRAPRPSPTKHFARTSPSGITWRFRTCGR